MCEGEVGALVAVLDEGDVMRTGCVTLHDVKVALRAVIPLKSVGGTKHAKAAATAATERSAVAA